MTPLSELAAAGPSPLGGPRPGILATREDNGVLTVSGQIAAAEGVLLHSGQVGAAVSLAQARECAWRCARNLLTVVERELGSLERVVQIDRVTVYVASAPDFTDQHLVADAATEAFILALGERGRHARTALGVAALPAGSPTEVDAVIRIQSR
ncbi:RidA family protein [Dactylosporangium sp. CA-139066]|uniref:RidA family protein n=1 Tax=Dactylosporangium sp. CA-139066 TaxID=3239930 RepID=UPI003D8EA12B